MSICTVSELNQDLVDGKELLLLDVRTSEELAIAHIEGARHIPLDELGMRSNELDDWRDRKIVCMCHHGMRSAHAQQILMSRGFSQVVNLTGGIHAWAEQVDPEMAKY